MAARHHLITARLIRPKVVIPTLLLLAPFAGELNYRILLQPNSIFIRWDLAALPSQITMISFGPCPDEAEYQRLKKNRAGRVRNGPVKGGVPRPYWTASTHSKIGCRELANRLNAAGRRVG